MKRGGRCPPYAFTLLELVVTLTITALIAGASAAVLRSVTAARAAADRRLDAQQDATLALNTIATALRNAYRPLDAGDDLFAGSDEGSAESDLPADRVRFRCVSRRGVRPGQPESDVREVEFFLAPTRPGSPPALMRRTDPTRNDPPDGGGVLEPIASGVVGMQIEYFDGITWERYWSQDIHRWPTAVRVRLAYVADPDKRLVESVERTVNLPYWVPRQPTGKAGPGAAGSSGTGAQGQQAPAGQTGQPQAGGAR
jgi:type II secretory pathway pseudopilin PulG